MTNRDLAKHLTNTICGIVGESQDLRSLDGVWDRIEASCLVVLDEVEREAYFRGVEAALGEQLGRRIRDAGE